VQAQPGRRGVAGRACGRRLERGEHRSVRRELAPDDRLHAAVALLEVGQQRASRGPGEVGDERRVAVVQGRKHVAGVRAGRRDDVAEHRPDGAGLVEHG
jgi:hypothetical protein